MTEKCDEKITKVAVVGAGTMGAGIAQLCAQSGYEVLLFDTNQKALAKGMAVIRNRLDQEVAKGRLTAEENERISGNIRSCTEWEELGSVAYLTEAVTEKVPVKQELFSRLETVCGEETLFATNTSGLSITEIASVLNRPERIVGTHYFYPVPRMKLVEIVRSAYTTEQTVRRAINFVKSLGKTHIEVKESPLFVVNRLLIPMINEAIFLLEEGVCRKEDIDAAMRLGAHHQIGPLALADVIGLDTLLYVVETLHSETGDPKYRAAPLLRQMVRSGWLGKKTGRGFYEYAAQEC